MTPCPRPPQNLIRRPPQVSPPTGDGTLAFSGESYPAVRSGAGRVARGSLLQ
jgi:hypothetical protein